MAMKEELVKKAKSQPTSPDYTAIVQSRAFKQLLQEKRNFLLPFCLFFMAFYFTLPILTAYTTVLNNPAYGPISWAWVFAFAQFIMTWALCSIYTRKASKFDALVAEIKETYVRGK